MYENGDLIRNVSWLMMFVVSPFGTATPVRPTSRCVVCTVCFLLFVFRWLVLWALRPAGLQALSAAKVSHCFLKPKLFFQKICRVWIADHHMANDGKKTRPLREFFAAELQMWDFWTPKVALLKANCGTFEDRKWHFWKPKVALLKAESGTFGNGVDEVGGNVWIWYKTDDVIKIMLISVTSITVVPT